MESFGLGLPGSLTPGTLLTLPCSQIRAISAADTPLRESTGSVINAADAYLTSNGRDTLVKTAGEDALQTPAKRRRSIRERTPKQVQAVLSERKKRFSMGVPRKELTPGGLLRALSRMPDLPPATPSEADSTTPAQTPETVVGSSGLRRGSYVPRHSSLAPVLEHLSPASSHARTLDNFPADFPADSADLPADTSLSSAASSTSSSAEVAETLLGAQRLSRSFSQLRRSVSIGSPAASEKSMSRRDSLASVASVEQARRASVQPEDLTRFLLRRRQLPVEGDKEAKHDEDDVGSGSLRESIGGIGRFSMGSELGGDLSFAALAADVEETASNPRLSLASGFGDVSSARLSLATTTHDEDDDIDFSTNADLSRVDKEDRNEFAGRFADVDDPLAGQEFGGGFDNYDETSMEQKESLNLEGEGGVDEEDLTDRIPWDLKGKGRAVEENDAEQGDGFDGVEAENDNAADEWFGAQGAGRFDSEQPLGLPTPPPFSPRAKNRKRPAPVAGSPKRKKQKRQRYTRSGEEVPDLPKSRQKALFQHFLGPGIKLDEAAVEALLDASQDFFAALMDDATASAKRSGRKAALKDVDLVEAMHCQRLLSTKTPLPSLARELGIDRELLAVLEGIDTRGSKQSTRRKKRKAEETSEEEDE
ncbi:Proteophosphoglycan ppg4 [Rhodotorula toruloides ATCC 204091]|uniref:BY PROTMAP: gi/342320934/gb/EGU12872.1/ Proteophosphoglycan ppg4 [Rhodotorula glutinis ATCC 204091] n=1 Tax=Rhodotorula toruloides TaxID=5286 RepID=A0A0K3CAX4_RHOTO|nr:Proteophosphoglycan ppg4 [Rhodotorula toruloides ATCC 204091]